MNNLYRNLDLADLASKVRTFTLNLQDYEMIAPAIARVCVTVSGNAPVKEQVRASLSELFKGLASPVASSFRHLTTAGGMQVLVGFVKSAHEVRAMEDVDQSKMKAMASNLLMDKTDESMWEIRNGSTGKFLVKQGDEDLAELAQSLHTKKSGLPTLAYVQQLPVLKREFAAWVDIGSEEVQHGYVVESSADKLTVIAHGDDDVSEIEVAQLVEVVNLDGEDIKAYGMELAADGMDRAAMVEYYKKAYGYSPDYVQKIIDMIDQHSYA